MNRQPASNDPFEALAAAASPERDVAIRSLVIAYELLDTQAHARTGTEHDDQEIIDVYHTEQNAQRRTMFEHRASGWYQLESTGSMGQIRLHGIHDTPDGDTNNIVTLTAICEEISELLFDDRARVAIIQN